MASFSRVFSSSFRAFKSAARRRPVTTAAMSYIAISYAAPPLIHSFINTNDDDDDLRRPFRAMDLLYPSRMWWRSVVSWIDRHIKVTETEESMILRYNLVNCNVRKEDVVVFVDHRNTLKIKDVAPGRNRISGTLDLSDYDAVNITAKLENNVLEIVLPKLKKKEEGDEEDEDFIVRRVNVE